MPKNFSVNAEKHYQETKDYEIELSSKPIEEIVKELFDYLDYTEESESGRVFHPISFSSCRVGLSTPFTLVLAALRKKVNEYHDY